MRGRVRHFAMGAVVAALWLGLGPLFPAQGLASADENPFVREAVLQGPSDLVWRLLTTEQGLESWLAPHAEVDLRIGGLVKTNYQADGRIGDPMTLVNRVVALNPGKAVTVRVDQAPSGYPFANVAVGTWYEVTVEQLAPKRSRVRCVGHGLPAGYMALMVKPMFEKVADAIYDHLGAAVDREAPFWTPPAPQPTPRTSAKPPAGTPATKPPSKETQKRRT